MPRYVIIIGLICAVIAAALIASAVTGWPHDSAPATPEVTIISLN